MYSRSGLQTEFFNDACHACVTVEGPQDEADIYADTFVVARRAVYVTGKGFLVAVESQTDEFAS